MWIESFMRVMQNKITVRYNFPLSLAKIKRVGLTGGEGMRKRQTHRHRKTGRGAGLFSGSPAAPRSLACLSYNGEQTGVVITLR